MALTLPPATRLVAATHNPGKARELAALLNGRFEVVSAGELGLPEPEEPESTFMGNAMIKARAAADASGLIALADDSGLSVAALDRTALTVFMTVAAVTVFALPLLAIAGIH